MEPIKKAVNFILLPCASSRRRTKNAVAAAAQPKKDIEQSSESGSDVMIIYHHRPGVPVCMESRVFISPPRDRNDPQNKYHGDGPPSAPPLPPTCSPFLHDPSKVALFRRGLIGFTDRVPSFTLADIQSVTEDDADVWIEKATVPLAGSPPVEVVSCVMTGLPESWVPEVPGLKVSYARFEPQRGDILNRSWFDEDGVRREIVLPPYCLADPGADMKAWMRRNVEHWPEWAAKMMPFDVLNRLLERKTLTPLAVEALKKLGAFLMAKTCKIGCGYLEDGSALGISKDHDFAILAGRYPGPRMPVAQSDVISTMMMTFQQREIWSLYRRLLASEDPNDEAPAYVFKELLVYHGAVELQSCTRRGHRTSNFPFKEHDIVREMYEGTKAIAAAYRQKPRRTAAKLVDTDPLVAELDRSLQHLRVGEWEALSLGDCFQRLHS
ncbi:hypothetical protein QBC47DRAFT_358347 [Echria macrotheca]|uniref:Uncharacterized protein n=1 Tax=Echria macrotheca TaxID=438768 RepID=A0AAJ0BID4_9PEZI|nr:hypothetical protein QBC47DRAFT_358347 [Echria macrotheca]